MTDRKGAGSIPGEDSKSREQSRADSHFTARFVHALIDCLRHADWLNRERARMYPRLLLPLVAVMLLPFLHWRSTNGATVQPLGLDFTKCWAASSMALGGHPAEVYDNSTMWRAEKAAVGGDDPGFEKFDYPPTFLALVLPLSLVPYNWSLLIWTVLGLSLYLSVICRAADRRDAVWAALVFPGAVLTIIAGQNGFITTALLGGGLLVLESRPWAAGACFGLLCYKPQFGFLLPLVLIAGRRGRAFAGAAVTALAFAAVSLALFGVGTWREFMAGIPDTTHNILERGGIGFGKMQSVFTGARLWGASVGVSYAIQAMASIGTGAAVLWIWSKPVRFPLKASALVIGTLLVTPYLVDYDLVLVSLPVAWLAAEGINGGFLPWEKSLLMLAWVFPIFARLVATLASTPLAPVILVAMLIAIGRRVLDGSAEDLTSGNELRLADPSLGDSSAQPG